MVRFGEPDVRHPNPILFLLLPLSSQVLTDPDCGFLSTTWRCRVWHSCFPLQAWTKEFWRSNLRYHPKGIQRCYRNSYLNESPTGYEPPKGIVTNASVNLHNFDTESPYAALPGSPHSVEALQREVCIGIVAVPVSVSFDDAQGVRPDFILFKPPESFNQIGIAPDRVMLRYQAHEVPSQPRALCSTSLASPAIPGILSSLIARRGIAGGNDDLALQALRRETIAMLRKKRQQVAHQAGQDRVQRMISPFMLC